MAWVLRIALGLAAGGAVGFLVSRILCAGGACPITSNRPLMVAMGAVFGVWLAVSGCSKAGTGEKRVFGTELSSSEEFQAKVINSTTPALVDFHATWCPPCLELAPLLARLEREYAGKVAFFRVDTDRAEALSREHEIQYLPTLLLYRGGERVARMEGLKPEAELRRELDQLLRVE